MIDWSPTQLELKRLINEIYDDLTERNYKEADAKLTQIVVEARLIRAFINTITRPE